MFEHNVAEIQHSDKEPDTYAVFCTNRALYLSDGSFSRHTFLANLPEIDPVAGPIQIYFHEPYISVSERFGLHTAVVDRRDGFVRCFERKDYHYDVSSYSIGFVEREGATLLIHQTDWNRLDITNLQTGKHLTEREITYDHELSRKINFLDYFHSILNVSPDGMHFLSNGWMWAPVGNILCFETGAFLNRFELSNVALDYYSDYNWDCPCTFINDNVFVVAVDKASENFEDEEYLNGYEYKQLWFYDLSNIEENKLICNKKVPCDCFKLNDEGEIWGEMYYDTQKNALAILSEKGGFIVSLEGEILSEYPDMALPDRTANGIFRKDYQIKPVWKYSPEHHFFYKYSFEEQKVITRA